MFLGKNYSRNRDMESSRNFFGAFAALVLTLAFVVHIAR
jgi:hypothetical protein